MPVYEYKALNEKGKKKSGFVDADGAAAARLRLRGSGLYPVSINEIQRTQQKGSVSNPITGIFNRIRPAEVAVVTRQLSTLVGAGFPLVTAIDSVIPQTDSNQFRRMLTQIKGAVVEGKSFAESLSIYSRTFSSLYINMVHSGESSGTLEIVLERLADLTEKQEAFKNKIRTSLAYPLLMSLVGALVLSLLLTYIVPKITVIFTDMNQALPAPTLLLIRTSDTLKDYWWIFMLVPILLLVATTSIKRMDKGRRAIDNIVLKLPVIGPLTRKIAAGRFSRTLGSLLENGVSMIPALGIVKNIVGSMPVSEAVEAASQRVGRGQDLGSALGETDMFPGLCIQMIQVGEHSGELESMLHKVADMFEREVESSIMRMTALLEPVMILVMGAIVGFIVLSICLPIFEMNQLVR